MTITTRAVKGTDLTHVEMDENFTDLRDGVDMQVPKTKGKGIKVDSLGTPTFGWHDLHGFHQIDANSLVKPTMESFRGNITEFQFAESAEWMVRFHLPHDYVMGSDIFLHVHWCQDSATLTGGSVTWGMEITYAKGHDQAPYPVTKTVTVLQNADLVPYQHMIAEGAASISGGSASQLDSGDLEVDGMLICRFYLDSNDMLDSVLKPNPFVHMIDIHYQSTGLPTKQKAPDFWT